MNTSRRIEKILNSRDTKATKLEKLRRLKQEYLRIMASEGEGFGIQRGKATHREPAEFHDVNEAIKHLETRSYV